MYKTKIGFIQYIIIFMKYLIPKKSLHYTITSNVDIQSHKA